MKTKFRTPRKILSVFLCILMLTTSVVIANPFTAAAADDTDKVTFDPSRYGNYSSNSHSLTVEYQASYQPTYNLHLIVLGPEYCWFKSNISGMSGAFSDTCANSANPNLTGTAYNTSNHTNYLDFFSISNKSYRKYVEESPDAVLGLSMRNPYLYAFYDNRYGVSNTVPSVKTYFTNRQHNWHGSDALLVSPASKEAVFSASIAKGEVENPSTTVGIRDNLHSGGPTAYIGPSVYYYGIDSTELYNLYKQLYVGYNEGYYVGSPKEALDKPMHAAELVLQGKLDRQIVAPVAEGGYGYCCICQELLDAIVADLKSVKIKVNFKTVISTRSDPADAATFNPIAMPDDYTKGLDLSINVSDKYNADDVKLVVNDKYGVELGSYTPTSNSGSTYYFNVPITGYISEIVATGFTVNEYSVSLPSGKGYSASCDTTIYDPAAIVHGTYLPFAIALDEQYNRSVPVVKYNGTLLEPTDGGIYTIKVTNEIKPGEITVENVELNRYYITLPLETETGFTIVVGDGLNAKSVLSGTDFDFKFFLDPAYSDSNPVIKYSADGGNNYKVLTEEDGKYTIENVLSDCIVVVEGVKKNTYTVNFTQEDGTIIKQYKDVEYGAEVVFDGTEPTKASEVLNEYEEDGNKVVVTKEYKFVGWSADTTKVVSNMTVTPIFEVSEVKTTTPIGGGESTVVVTPKTANVLFVSDGVIIHKETVTKGESFSGWNGTPVKASSNPYETYTFIGWDTDRDGVVDVKAGESNAIADVQNDVTYTAVFESNLPSQTVNFYNFDGSELLYSASVKRGEKAEYGLSGSPERRDDANLYDFAGWALTTDADETEVVEKLIVGENNVDFFAAYSREPIVYSYKFVNDGELLQEGSFYYGDRYKYLGSTPVRASSVSTDYTFDGWDVAQSGYTSVYTATYSESVREYTSNLPTPDTTYTITENKTVKYGDTFSFTVTVAEGYEETAPVVTSNGTAIEPASKSGNSYTYEIKLDGATAEEVYGDLTVTVGTTINNYDVKISGDAGCTVDPLAFNSAHGGEGSFIVTLKDGYTQTEPTINFEGDVAVTLDKAEGNVYTYKVTGIKSDAKITVETAINTYKVVMVNWDGETVFDDVLTHGATPEYTNPTRKNDEFGGYTFIGWDTDGKEGKDVDVIANVTSDIYAVAVYECNHTHAEDPTAEGTAWVLDSIEQATCTEDGVRHYKCSYPGCTETKDWTIPARHHKMGEYTVTLAPTCTKDGSKIRYCVNGETDDYAKCNHSETAVVEKLGHAYGEWKTIVAPTCTEKGKAERVCANDPSHKEYKDIDATGHHDSDEDYICDDCGVDLGHCSKCICHKGNILSKVLRYICTLLTKTFHKPIKCCKDMDWYGDKISSIS